MKDQKLFLFDMGNTLLDFHFGPHTDDEKDEMGLCYMKDWIFKRFQKSVTESQLRVNFLEPWLADFIKRELGKELDVETYLFWLEEYVGAMKKEDHICLMRMYYKAYLDEVVSCPGAERILKKLRSEGKMVGIISNCILYEELYQEAFEKVGFAPYIHRFYFSYAMGCRKPDKRLFLKALRDFDVLPENAVMIGDSLKADMIPAKELGIKTIWVNKHRGNLLKSVKTEFVPDIEVEALSEIENWL